MRVVRYLVFVVLFAGTAAAQGRRPPHPPPPPPPPIVKPPPLKPGEVQEIVVGGIKLVGTDHNARMLYFLERANEELERSSLQKRSFIPQLARTVENEKL
jgi:hypothetical protein